MKENLTLEGILTGIGLSLAATVLLPVIKNTARPLTLAGIQGATLLGNEIKSGISYIKEEIEDIIAEAQFERMKKSIDKDIML